MIEAQYIEYSGPPPSSNAIHANGMCKAPISVSVIW